ncbi:helix-turn-helix domain-containing protein [Streptomyces sp. MUSC 14]|uniref:helix-turn-helix domain-containing protein n=1 Tax=Streptomyces sp. MUSC 14 TaxID=1354889 RepID=UPI00210D187F|nr:helix-turn-helix domain-containing protein [Streptomyces sp. MUSC 14]
MTPWERERGERFGTLLRRARGSRSTAEVAAAAGVSAETLRKIETGRAPTPAFLTIAALAAALHVSLDELAGRRARTTRTGGNQRSRPEGRAASHPVARPGSAPRPTSCVLRDVVHTESGPPLAAGPHR